jgi:hypothetical protein
MSHPRRSLRDTSVPSRHPSRGPRARPARDPSARTSILSMTYRPDPPNSPPTCRIRDTRPSRPRRAPDASPPEDAPMSTFPHVLRLSWCTPTTSRRVHGVTLRGQACAAGFGRATATEYDLCTPPAPFVTKSNPAKSRRSAGPFPTPETTRLTASTEERSNRPPPRVVVVAPRPAQPLVGRVWTGGGSAGEERWLRSPGARSSRTKPKSSRARSSRTKPKSSRARSSRTKPKSNWARSSRTNPDVSDVTCAGPVGRGTRTAPADDLSSQ